MATSVDIRNEDNEITYNLMDFLGYDLDHYRHAGITDTNYRTIATSYMNVFGDIEQPVNSEETRREFGTYVLIMAAIERIAIEPSPIESVKKRSDHEEGVRSITDQLMYMAMLTSTVYDYITEMITNQTPTEIVQEYEQEVLVRTIKQEPTPDE